MSATLSKEKAKSSLSLRLKTETLSEHDRMEKLMLAAQAFDSIENYGQFTLSQYYFQQDVEHLYQYPEVKALIPDLDVRGRSAAALQDLEDLNIRPQGHDLATINVAYPEALGWIYVSEGSTLGAAILYKVAQQRFGLNDQHGARNLAAYPDGRMRVWKRFKAAIDGANFSKPEQDQVVAGALAAFAYFGLLIENLGDLK